MDSGHTAWVDDEVPACKLADERLPKQLRKLVGQVGGAMGQSIPTVSKNREADDPSHKSTAEALEAWIRRHYAEWYEGADCRA
jgi:hypothetical protein